MSAPSRGLMGNCLFRNIVLEFACLRATDLIFTRYIRVWGPPFFFSLYPSAALY